MFGDIRIHNAVKRFPVPCEESSVHRGEGGVDFLGCFVTRKFLESASRGDDGGLALLVGQIGRLVAELFGFEGKRDVLEG